jgi:hypothetical protein
VHGRLGDALELVAQRVVDAVTGEILTWNKIPPDLTKQIATYDRRAIVELVTKHYPNSVQAGLILNRGVFFIQLSIESFYEDQRIIDQRTAAQEAQLAITTKERQAKGEGEELGQTAYIATVAALGPRPYDDRDYDELTPAQQARVDAWDASRRRTLEKLLDRAVYRTTNATVFTEGGRGSGPQPTVAVPLGGAKKAPEQPTTPPADAGDATGAP